MTTICVDVMGADKEPPVLLEGVEAALAADPELEVLVAGAADVVEPFAASHSRARALVTTEVIAMSEHPANAVRVKKDASIVRAAAAVRAGEADGLFSAGSTGAVLTAATFGVGRIKGIKRPALSLPFPGVSGKATVFLDMGANADVKPDVLVQFAHMGRAYSRAIIGVDEPRVGLLCNGSEDTKGSEMALAYHAALEAGDCGFAGNAEGTDLLAGTFDVIVADGFTGNVALKSIEGTGKFVIKRLKAAMGESLGNKIGMALLAKSLKSLAAEMSGDEYGGAILLGLRAPVVKGHGATSARAVCQGTLAAAAAVRAGLTDKIAAACEIAG
ncbi:phosphate acyltransferase PlsX [Olsenella sp. SW781]|uniref:phosphate acyltransferase PlsX n=1 Tax=Olsenella sp. SW781 TaxID=2530046 RepID=UPI001438CE1B|nr:phosphate acyltransferase PlsX [Olsenella sp. SW781]NJE79739.1 phosphate acyltransferase PlsX [Olsenella sp. SW781]